MEKAVLPNIPLDKKGLESLQAEAIQKLKDNPAVYARIQELKMTAGDVKKHLGTLLNFYEEALTCQNCPGLDKCPKATRCFETGIDFDGEFLETTKAPCQKQRDRLLIESRFLQRDFEDAWIESSFKDVDRQKSRIPLLTLLGNILLKKDASWPYVNGNFNTGRSFILASFLNTYAAQNDARVAFCDTASLMDELKSASIDDKEYFKRKFEALVTCEVLVLDGFGNEYKTEFTFSKVVLPLLQDRIKKGLVTAFTSDFTINEIVSMYASKVGQVRAKQLGNLIRSKVEKEYPLEGINVK